MFERKGVAPSGGEAALETLDDLWELLGEAKPEALEVALGSVEGAACRTATSSRARHFWWSCGTCANTFRIRCTVHRCCRTSGIAFRSGESFAATFARALP